MRLHNLHWKSANLMSCKKFVSWLKSVWLRLRLSERYKDAKHESQPLRFIFLSVLAGDLRSELLETGISASVQWVHFGVNFTAAFYGSVQFGCIFTESVWKINSPLLAWTLFDCTFFNSSLRRTLCKHYFSRENGWASCRVPTNHL